MSDNKRKTRATSEVKDDVSQINTPEQSNQGAPCESRTDSTKLLMDISEKLTLVVDNLVTLNVTMNKVATHVFAQKDNSIRPETESLQNVIQATGSNITEEIRRLQTDMKQVSEARSNNAQERFNDASEIWILNEAKKNKTGIKLWTQKLNTRKMDYSNTLRCKSKAEIYKQFLSHDEVFIPKHFRSKNFQNESQGETSAKKNLDIQKMRAAIEILECRSEQSQTNYIKMDSEMEAEIRKIKPESVAEKVLQMWQEDCNKEEQISKQKWKKKEEFLLNLPNNQQSSTVVEAGSNGQQTNSSPKHYSQEQSRARQFQRNQGYRPRENNQRRMNTSNINPNSYFPRGPSTSTSGFTITRQNEFFQQGAFSRPPRSQQRFLSVVGNSQNPT